MSSFLEKLSQWRKLRRLPNQVERLLNEGNQLRQRLMSLENKLDGLREWQAVHTHRINYDDRFWYPPNNNLARRRIVELTEMMIPCEARGFGKVRLGNKHDGGYILLDDFQNIDATFSLGISDDVSWDVDVANKSVQVYQYDHTILGPPVSHPGFHFYQKRIGTAAESGETIAAILSQHGVTRIGSAIMKMDIEGAEWGVLDETTDDTLALFSQITGEFHGFDEVLDDKWFECALRVISRLNKHFSLVHVHGNNFGQLIVIDEVLFPRSLELTFANRSRYALAPSNEVFPGQLDAPNNPNLPDCGLGHFIYRRS
jgi:Methyltransferase FkbM domain